MAKAQEVLAQVEALLKEIFSWLEGIFAGLKKDEE